MILVTGGTGLIGSHLLYEITSNNHLVRAIKRSGSNTQNVLKIFGYYSENPEALFNKIQWVDSDLTDYFSLHTAFEDIERVYHCAGLVSFNRRKKNTLFNTNVTGTSNIVNLSLEKSIKKLCFVSSIASFGEYDGNIAVDETTRWKPDKKCSFYSLSKLKAEMEVWRGIAEGLDAVIINPSVVLGPGFWNNGVGHVFRMVSRGFRFYTHGSTGYIDVRDVAKIMVMLMESDISGEQFLLSSENLSFKEILTLISGSIDGKKPDIHVNRFLSGISWRISSLVSFITRREPILTRDNARISNKHSVYSGKKLQDRLNYKYIDIRETVRFLAEKYNTEYNKGK